MTPPYISLLSGISPDAPAFARCHTILCKAAECGFSWPDAASVLTKIGEELDEIGAAERKGDTANLKEEIGDALSAVITLVCFTGADPAGLVTPPPQPLSRAVSADMLLQSHARLSEAVSSGQGQDARVALQRLMTEVVTFAQRRGVDAQDALQDANDKFVYRFDHVGRSLHAQGRAMADAGLEDMIRLWNECKTPEAAPPLVRRIR